MLSSLTSFLPSRLQGATSKELPRPAVIPDEQSDDEGDEPEPTLPSQPDSKPLKSKDRDGKGPSEDFWLRPFIAQLLEISLEQVFSEPTRRIGKTNDPILGYVDSMTRAVVHSATLIHSTLTFVFVRPPPSISNHPLNLQVQLVPPNSRLPTGIPSAPNSAASTTSAYSNGTPLCRTPSNHSQSSSSTFNNSSTTSFASFSSSTTSTRRAIIPLYNLQAHNVMTNVIVDAGTDAKIAKFQKRGIELIDLAYLEPVEVWGEKDGRSKDADLENRIRTESMRLSVDGSVRGSAVRSMKSTASLAPSGSGIGSGTGTVALPASPSANSLSSQPTFSSAHGGSLGEQTSHQNNQHLHPSDSRGSVRSDTSPLASSPITPTAASPSAPTPKKNIFGKLFNKKSGAVSPTPSSNSITPTNTSQLSKQTEGLPSFGSFSILQSPKISRSPKQVPEDLDESLLQTPTAGSKEKGHGRNLSLTGITAIKSTLKHNRNRLSGMVSGISPSSNANPLGALGIRDESLQHAGLSTTEGTQGRAASPNPSVASRSRSRLSGVARSTATQSTDSLPADNGLKDADITIIATTPTQLQTYPLVITPSHPEGTRQPQQQQFQLRPPVLGCQTTFVSSALSSPPTHLNAGTSPLVAALSPRMNSEKDVESLLQGQRALLYVWLVRKWLKKRVSTILGGEATAAGIVGGLFGKRKEASTSGQDMSGPPPVPYGGVEVRFEWKRSKGKEAKGVRRTRRLASGVSSIGDFDAGSDGEVELSSSLGDPSGRLRREERRKYRMSAGSFTTVSEENGLGLSSSPGSRLIRRDGDDGEESDPEDSETPWVCTLKVRRSASAGNGSAASTSGGRLSPVPPTPTTPNMVPLEPQVLRVKVGTLSPTPHHPKVVAMLKVPFPLPDVEVERMGVVKRDAKSMGLGSTSTGGDGGDAEEKEPYVGLTLTAEEIKDVVCSTGLWLVVREGFGGVGKVARKGDGWRIRS